ncbi:hypothetical protein SMICM17S_05866 [Streptomyces microflavus]
MPPGLTVSAFATIVSVGIPLQSTVSAVQITSVIPNTAASRRVRTSVLPKGGRNRMGARPVCVRMTRLVSRSSANAVAASSSTRLAWV